MPVMQNSTLAFSRVVSIPRNSWCAYEAVIASGLYGPRRAAASSLRDFVLGVSLLDGCGEVLRFGGQMMKNVAGYDVSGLLAGSLGVLGLIVDVSPKVLPKPRCETTLRFQSTEEQALAMLGACRFSERVKRRCGCRWVLCN